MKAVNLAGKLGTFSEHWSPKIVSQFNGHDVMVVKGERERMIPFVQGDYIHSVDLEQGLIEVDWDSEF